MENQKMHSEVVKIHIATRIKEIRNNQHLTQNEFGAQFKEPRCSATISSWEKARTTPDADTLLEICERYRLSINYFYPNEKPTADTAMTLSPDEAELIATYRALSNSAKKAVLINTKALAGSYLE